MVFWQAVHSFTHSLAYAIFQNSPRCTNQHHTLRKNTVCCLFCSSLHTHGNDVVSLLRANAGNVSLPGTYLGYRWTRSSSSSEEEGVGERGGGWEEEAEEEEEAFWLPSISSFSSSNSSSDSSSIKISTISGDYIDLEYLACFRGSISRCQLNRTSIFKYYFSSLQFTVQIILCYTSEWKSAIEKIGLYDNYNTIIIILTEAWYFACYY